MVLILREWLNAWHGSTQYVLNRNISYHYPIMMRNSLMDRGPKPFRVLNCWFQDRSFHGMLKEVWRNIKMEGWDAFVLKKKLKGVKEALKKWNVKEFGLLNVKINKDNPCEESC